MYDFLGKLLRMTFHYNNYLKSTASNSVHNGSIMDNLVRDVQLVSSQYKVCVSGGSNDKMI